MYCKNCGRQITDESQFCPFCGKDPAGAAVPAVYDDAKPFADGLAYVQLNGKWGYIDTEGTQYWED